MPNCKHPACIFPLSQHELRHSLQLGAEQKARESINTLDSANSSQSACLIAQCFFGLQDVARSEAASSPWSAVPTVGGKNIPYGAVCGTPSTFATADPPATAAATAAAAATATSSADAASPELTAVVGAISAATAAAVRPGAGPALAPGTTAPLVGNELVSYGLACGTPSAILSKPTPPAAADAPAPPAAVQPAADAATGPPTSGLATMLDGFVAVPPAQEVRYRAA